MVTVKNGTSLLLQTLIYVMNQTHIPEENSYNFYYMEIGKESNSTRCYGIYGCFHLSPPWTSEQRPISLFPESLSKIEPRYPVYTRRDPDNAILIDLNDLDPIKSAGIDPVKPVYVISHGYMEGGGIPWILEMTKELLKFEDCTVIVVDWNGGSGPPYTQAVANIRLVGAITAHVLADLAQYTGSRKLDHVHCIGHSLGAHLSGYVGYTLQNLFNLTLGRISGLDPAEPHFSKTQPPVRLDRTAAKYVDVVHTDASQFIRFGLGMIEPIGHVDYYPNGGTKQPGCGKSVAEYISEAKGSLYHGVRWYLGCNHMRSYKFFIESINPKCSFMTITCPSYDDFDNGKCFDCYRKGQHCLTFGFHSRRSYQKLLYNKIIRPDDNLIQYFKTGQDKPFCRAHYRIIVTVSGNRESQVHGGEVGQLYFTMHTNRDGNGSKSDHIPFNSGGYHEPGVTYTAVLPSSEIKHLNAIEVEWRYTVSLFNLLTWRILATPKIFLERIEVDALEIHERLVVCPKNEEPLFASVPMLMLPEYC